jgi:hypothetical protein
MAGMRGSHALFKMVRYVLLRPLRPELDDIQNNCRVKAHVGIHGNEIADLLAKRETTLGAGPNNPIEDLPI